MDRWFVAISCEQVCVKRLLKAGVAVAWELYAGASGVAQPHRVNSVKVRNDPQFAETLEAIVGLHLNPPENALVLSVDEKSQIRGAGPHTTQPAEAAGHYDARLQVQRYYHPVRHPDYGGRGSLRAVPATASASGMAALDDFDRSGGKEIYLIAATSRPTNIDGPALAG